MFHTRATYRHPVANFMMTQRTTRSDIPKEQNIINETFTMQAIKPQEDNEKDVKKEKKKKKKEEEEEDFGDRPLPNGILKKISVEANELWAKPGLISTSSIILQI